MRLVRGESWASAMTNHEPIVRARGISWTDETWTPILGCTKQLVRGAGSM
jgi:hypothetical protein